ncbi:PREDICTED: rho GTPase-activating protein 32 [Corvus brachyrhynchos]|uniref:rho GTPase-activating protein 32 n=1 Tax=Corvus brachyrhynchos TaxID=85066 RepID=UPI000816573B|nr:PREDICTED: rho GTPase-activating protein 32 [Corvus brachyrhynchos]
MMKSSVHTEEDDFVPELQRSIHPRERPDWEETLSAMARGADIPDIPGELPLRSCGSTASMKVKNVKKYIPPGLMGCDAFHRLSFTKGHFPKMAECAHFHYENVDFGNIQLSLPEEQNEVTRNGCESKELVYLVQISCQGRSWIVKRSYEDFRVLDKHLHLCIYDRRFSQLAELPRSDALKDSPELVTQMLMAYLARLSNIAGNKINCGPALTWMEIDNKGNHLLVHEESSINVPAIAAAHVIKRYIAQAADELSFEVGDIVSVIDMPPKELTSWWRGKHGFQVGFFPSECVELINDKVPQSVTNSVPKPVSPAHGARPASWSYFPPYLEMDSVKPGSAFVTEALNQSHLSSVSKKHGKLITFLRTFMKSRPTKQKLKQRGILKERVFGCDLGEHLLNSGHDVPQVLKSCTEFIEKHGIVDGIYRLSGIASNIQKLRHEFDSEQIPDLTKDIYIQDIHCVGSLCKLYFRELPNPLLTYQLYEKFSDAVSAATDEERLVKIHDVIQQLPPPHYRTLEFLMRHLARLADYCSITNMHTKNLAIVWAPNLLRSKQIESACFSGTAAFMEVRIQSVVVEFILNHVDVLFSSKLSSVIRDGAGHSSLSRPKSLLVSSPSTKLLTLEEAQARTQAQINSPIVADSKYIEVGEGPAALQGKFHTVIDFPSERKRPPSKMKKSPVGSWRSFFNLGKSSSVSKRKLQRNPSEPSEMKAIALAGGRGDSGTLRSAKSEESLTSLHAVDGESKLFRPRRPRSSSDALSASFNGELLGNMNRCNSYDNLPHDDSDGDEGLIHVPALISPRSSEDVDLSPPDIGVASLDFDPMSFQCSPPQAESECLDSSTSLLESVDINKEKPSLLKKDLESGSQSQTPGSATSSEPVSPFQEKMSPFFTLDLSPTEEQACKPLSFSPKTARKPIKSPPLTTEPTSFVLPSRVPEALGGVPTTSRNSSASSWSKGIGITEITNRSPTQMSLPLKNSETGAGEGAHQELQHPQLVAACKAELPEEGERAMPSSQNKTVPGGHTQPGAVALDSPQDPVPVSSVSLIPPPPPKNAARMLALALAESAQQASAQSHKRPGDAHAESTNYGEAEAGTALEKLHLSAGAPDKLHLFTALPENRLHFQPGAPLEQDCQGTAGEQNHPPGAPGGQEPPPLHAGVPGDTPGSRDAEQEQCSFHPGPARPRAATAPAQRQEHQAAGGQVPAAKAPSGSGQVWSTAAPEKPPEPVPGFVSESSSSTRGSSSVPAGHQSQLEKPRESTRAPPLHLRSESVPAPSSYSFTPPVPPVRTLESKIAAAMHSNNTDTINNSVPPDDEPVYCPRPLYQYKPYQPHSDYHVTQLQPYFENGRVHYRYSPYSSSSSSPYYTAADGSFYDLDPYSTVRVRPFHGLPGREFGSYASRLQGKGLYRYPSLAAYPRAGLINHLGKEHSFVSRDVPPAPDIKHMYMSWDLEDMEKYRMQSIRRESRTRQKVKGPLMSQYDNVAPLLPDELGGLDSVHLRSKSDPGKSGLLTVAEGKEGRYPAKAATPEGDERYYGQHAEPELDRAHYHGGGYGNGQPEKPSLPQKQSSIRNRKMHEPGGSSSEHRTHLQQEASHRQPSEPKNGPPYSEYRPKGGPEPSEPMGYQHSGSKYIPAGQETLRLNHKEGRLAEDRPDLERPRGRASMEKHSRDCYKEEEHAAPSVAPPPKPERSHSLRMQHPEPMERDSALLYPYQTLGKRQSTMTVVSQYDNLEDYHTLPQHQRGGYAGAGGFVPPGFPHVHSRTYATALGQGAFLPTELCLQRPETEVHVE